MKIDHYFSRTHIVDNLERKKATGKGYNVFNYTDYQLTTLICFRWFCDDEAVYMVHARKGIRCVGFAHTDRQFVDVVFKYVSTLLELRRKPENAEFDKVY